MNAVMQPAGQDTRNGLHWLRAELDLSLGRVRDNIDQSLERGDDELLLQKCVVELHQIRGIATVVQCYGAACLADAMKSAVQALANGDEVRDREAAITALLGASVQFSDYLDLLTSGEQDALLVFHPMINELRVSCGLGVLSEADLVARHIFESGAIPLDVPEGASPDDQAAQAARKLLPALHKAMRSWVRGEERTDSLKRIGRIAEHLRGLAAGAGFGVLMQATAATVECLLALKLTDSLELKRQMGRVGELTKRVAVGGEQASDAPAMVRAAVGLGVEVFRSGTRSRRASALISRLLLDSCLVPDAQLEQMRISIRGPNTDVLTRVANEIREDFAQVKDEIDLAIRTGRRAPEQHESMARTLKRVSDTLSMLDLGALQRVIDRQADLLDTLELDAADARWMELATALLLVEHNLQDALFGHVRAREGDRRDPAAVLAEPPPVKLDHREGADAALRESLVNLSQLKDQISEYITRGEPGLLSDARRMLHQVESALSVLESDRGAALTARLQGTMDLDGFRDIRDNTLLADEFADAVALAECYIEALQQAQPQTEHLLDQLETALDGLDSRLRAEPEAVDAPAEAVEPPEPAAPDAIDPEIREVFLEEAAEVLETLQGHLPTFLRNTEDRETLTTIRRAFHTLKGSGRMVGAEDIGEFGWSVEHMLNRCLEGALSVTPAVVSTLEQAVEALPGVIGSFRDGEPLGEQASALVARTDRVARGLQIDEAADDYDPEIHRIFREDARQHLETMRLWLESQPANEHGRFPVTQDLVRALHTVAGASASLSLESVSELVSELEDLCETVMTAGLGLGDAERSLIYETMTELNAWLDADEAGVLERPGLQGLRDRAAEAHRELPEDVRKSSARRRLIVTFTDEAAELLDGIEQQIQAWKTTPNAEHHARKVAEALHTLKGSASMADIDDVKERAASLRERALARDTAGAEPPDATWFAAMDDGVEHIYQLLDAHRSGLAVSMPEQQSPLFEQAEDSSVASSVGAVVEVDPPMDPPDVMSTEAEDAAELTPAVVSAPDDDFDAELAATFAEEARELLQVIDRAFAVFEETPASDQPLDEMIRALHTLKGGARTTGLTGLGNVSHRLEDAVGELLAGRLSRDAAVVSQLHNVVDGLHALVDQLERAEIVDPRRVLDDIEDLERLGRQGDLAAAEPESEIEVAADAPVVAVDEPGAIPDVSPPAVAPEDVLHVVAPETTELASPADEPDLVVDATPPDRGVEQTLAVDLPTDGEPAEPMDDVGMGGASDVSGTDEIAAPEGVGLLPEQPATEAEEGDAEVVDIFLSEAGELLDEMGAALSGLAADPSRQPDAVATVRRCLHTLKGGARVAGLQALGEQTHALESELELQLPGGQFTPRWLRDAEVGAERLAAVIDEIDRGLRLPTTPDSALVDPVVDEPVAESVAPQPEEPTVSEPMVADFDEPAEPSIAPVDDEWIVDSEDERLTAAAEPESAASSEPAEPEIREWDERLFWTPPAVKDEQAVVRRETARVTVEQLDTMLNQAGEVGIFHSRLEQQASSLANQLNELQQTIDRTRAQLRQMELETDAQIQARQQGRSDQEEDRYEDEFDPLEMDRYTRMQELSRALNESVADLGNLHETLSLQVTEVDGMLRHQGQINTSLQQGLMSTLMVPFSRQVQRLQRVVRQTASEFGKAVTAEFEGIESEMDRNVLERMTGPLEHLLRNAVYHGIEAPDDRVAAGKPETGRIDVRLRREGTQLVMEVADDGRGLDLLKIRQKAVERGLLSPTAEPSDEAVAQFIFEPGFSTADSLSQVAGRGVGMDVVGAEVKHLGGSVDVRSELGKGVRFVIRLPLSLAISRALLMSVGDETYAVPIGGVQGIARIPADDVGRLSASEEPSFEYGGERYSVRYVGSLLGVPTPESFDARNLPVILTAYTEGLGGAERRVALVCDQLQGNREIVSKQVGPQVGAIAGMAGATIMPDGEVVLILDLAALLRADAQHASLQPVLDTASAEPAQGSDELTVMVVDDSITMRRVAERLLTRNGYLVTTAKDGMDAMAQLQGDRPDVMLLDIEMPRVDGFEVATYVRNTPELADLPIIMITSRSGDKHRERAARIGVNRYLIKPYQEAQLLSEIESVLGRDQEAGHG